MVCVQNAKPTQKKSANTKKVSPILFYKPIADDYNGEESIDLGGTWCRYHGCGGCYALLLEREARPK